MRINIFFSFPIFFLLMALAYVAFGPFGQTKPPLNSDGLKISSNHGAKVSNSATPLMPKGRFGPTAKRSSAVDPRIFLVDSVLRNYQSDLFFDEIWPLSEHIVQEADNVGIAPSLLLAVIGVESNFDPCAVSPVGAKGLMQVMPHRILGREKAATDFAFNHHLVYDPYWNISFGAAYLQELISRFGSLEMALSAYNRGPTRLSRQLRNRTYRGCGYTRKVFALQEAIEQHTI